MIQLALSSFLNWFEGSQALDRIVKMEKAKSAANDQGIHLININY